MKRLELFSHPEGDYVVSVDRGDLYRLGSKGTMRAHIEFPLGVRVPMGDLLRLTFSALTEAASQPVDGDYPIFAARLSATKVLPRPNRPTVETFVCTNHLPSHESTLKTVVDTCEALAEFVLTHPINR